MGIIVQRLTQLVVLCMILSFPNCVMTTETNPSLQASWQLISYSVFSNSTYAQKQSNYFGQTRKLWGELYSFRYMQSSSKEINYSGEKSFYHYDGLRFHVTYYLVTFPLLKIAQGIYFMQSYVHIYVHMLHEEDEKASHNFHVSRSREDSGSCLHFCLTSALGTCSGQTA